MTLKALEVGGIDFVPKSGAGVDLDMSSVKDELYRKLKVASKVRVVRTATRSKLQQEIATAAPRSEPAAKLAAKPEEQRLYQVKPTSSGAAAAAPAPVKNTGKFPIVVVAASTGGPGNTIEFVSPISKKF